MGLTIKVFAVILQVLSKGSGFLYSSSGLFQFVKNERCIIKFAEL